MYGADGCQITTKAAGDIYERIKCVDYFGAEIDSSVKSDSIPADVEYKYFEAVKKQSVLFGDEADREIKIVYTPLNGAGLNPVIHMLNEGEFENVTIVEEQRKPDERFPTCKKPNPEESEAMKLGIEYCHRENADLLIATDPDSDRMGTVFC